MGMITLIDQHEAENPSHFPPCLFVFFNALASSAATLTDVPESELIISARANAHAAAAAAAAATAAPLKRWLQPDPEEKKAKLATELLR